MLKDIDQDVLMRKTATVPWLSISGRKAFDRIWYPIIEERNAIDPFMTETPFDMLTNQSYESQIDTLFSISPMEEVFSSQKVYPEFLARFDEKFEIELSLEMAHVDFNSNVYKDFAKRIRDFYLDEKRASKETLDGVDLLTTDIAFTYGNVLNLRIQATKSKGRTFFSMFSVDRFSGI
ncbi:uncharacterized protein LOC129580051 [Sitodiplosis mosellana]|uniref:uncharacterized protein LOC129580048 n=1 Tax=Sitodiplosis mosellana TaxID=263140 RepID=UPI002444A36B|nr:uncharacterized protein LOC129580048 [Sitodiplosis mosellana]XP_055326222.1 uncharacterized protein LOC129580051 [Sitodiplosis mosellana]